LACQSSPGEKEEWEWRVCINFTDLNKACSKDSFLLPNRDQMVDATAGHELLSFMDAYSGTTKLRHPEDEDKTVFTIDRSIYCHRVIPFNLKNAGATF